MKSNTYFKTAMAFGLAAMYFCSPYALAANESINTLRPIQKIESFSMSSSNKTTDYTPEKAARDLTNTKGLIYLEKRGLQPKNIIPLGGKGEYYINIFENENLNGSMTLYVLKSEIGQKDSHRTEKKVYTVEGDLLIRNTADNQSLIAPFYRKSEVFSPNTDAVKSLSDNKWYPQTITTENRSSLLRNIISPNVKNIEKLAELRYMTYKKALEAYAKTNETLLEKNPDLRIFNLSNYKMAQLLGENADTALYFYKDSLTFETINNTLDRSVIYLMYNKKEDKAFVVRARITMPKAEFIRQCHDTNQMPDQMTIDTIMSIGLNMLPTLDYSLSNISKTKYNSLQLYIPMEYKK